MFYRLSGMKNNLFKICSIFFLIAVCSGCQHSSKYRFQTFSTVELKSDLESLIGKLDTVHFNLYHLHSKARFDSVHQSVYNTINEPLNAAEFYFRLLPIFNLLHDSHTMLGFPFSYNKEFAKQGGLFIPVKVFITGNKIYVSENLSSLAFPLYSEIVSVNGVPSAEILNTLHLMINREQYESESDYMAFFFHRILYPVYGFDKTYTLELITPGNQTRQIILPGIPLDKFPQNSQPDFSSRYLDSSTVVIDINTCENKQEFAAFCDSVFTSLQQNKIQNLVIDLRNNPGGSTFHGDTLFTFLTAKKFTQYTKRSIRYSPYSNPASDTVYTQTFADNLEQAHTNKKRFTGNVYMLANRNTFSSATVMAATFQCYKMGTLVGQVTGGTQVFFDEPVEFKLHNSGLRFLVANQVNYCPCGTDWNSGVIPEKMVTLSITDMAKGIDTEMEFVKSLINKNTEKSSQ
ncbi:MAG: hypothetical protein POELPBGB_01284 [Bacteroidia bacterium]|nr:hypothetical protein [Bacteroidia bacterium]